jgi:hypothetical protein
VIARTCVFGFVALLCACGSKSGTELRIYKDPFTGTEEKMRVARVDGVEITVLDSAPSALVVVSIDDRAVVGVLTTRPDDRQVMLLGKSNVNVTTTVADGKLRKIDYSGSEWNVWDENGVGQADLRVRQGSRTVEIWIDGHWQERRTVGAGKDRQYFVGDRRVFLSDTGWRYDGP